MKVTDVSLYRNGIGVFHGKTNGKFLAVKVKQMNDVLKTIRIVGSGKPQAKTNLTFPSPKSVNGDMVIDFDNPLLSIIKSLEGKKIEVIQKCVVHKKQPSSTNKATGIVMGIREEKFFKILNDNETKILRYSKKRYKLTLMIMRREEEEEEFEGEEEEEEYDDFEGEGEEEGGRRRSATNYKLKQFYLDELDSINLLDGSKKIEDYIDVQNMKNSDSEIKLRIIGGTSPYNVVYANSVAVWKVIYEINLEKEKAQLTLYSVVDNNSSNDWNDVNLNLVSEVPYSVHTDLFSIISLEKTRSHQIKKGKMQLLKRRDPNVHYEEMAMAESEPMVLKIEEAVVKDVGAIEGSFKQFTTKASIEMNESSKVLLKTYDIKVEDWLYCDKIGGYESLTKPDMAIAVISPEGFSMNGPLTIYNNHTYLGESSVERIKATTTKEEVNRNIFTYAKDLQCDVSKHGYSPVLLAAQVTGFSRLIIRIKFYYEQVTIYNVKYARKNPIKFRLVNDLHSTNFVTEDVLEKITGKKQKLDECGGNIEVEKEKEKKEKVTAVITKVELRDGRDCVTDFDMNKSFKATRHQYYFEVQRYNLLDKMHIISLLDINIVLEDIEINKKNLIKHANLVEEREKLERRYEKLDNVLLTTTTETKGLEMMYKEKENIEAKIKELTSEIKKLRDNIIDNLKFDKGFVKKSKKVKK